MRRAGGGRGDCGGCRTLLLTHAKMVGSLLYCRPLMVLTRVSTALQTGHRRAAVHGCAVCAVTGEGLMHT